MKTTAAVTDALQVTANNLAQIIEQSRVDARQLKANDYGFLAKLAKCWYEYAEKHLKIVIDRLIDYGLDPAYSVSQVAGFKDVTSFLGRTEKSFESALEQVETARRISWDAQAGYTTDIYEHIVRDLEEAAEKVEREMFLLKKLGGEAAYLAARMN